MGALLARVPFVLSPAVFGVGGNASRQLGGSLPLTIRSNIWPCTFERRLGLSALQATNLQRNAISPARRSAEEEFLRWAPNRAG